MFIENGKQQLHKTPAGVEFFSLLVRRCYKHSTSLRSFSIVVVVVAISIRPR